MKSATQTVKIGPGAIATPSVEGGPGFLLSTTEWLAIQTYVIDALALPTTMDAFKASLGPGAPSDMSDFTQLVTAYSNINKHVTAWQDDTFPATVSLASDIYNYAQKVPIYYDPILPLAKKLSEDPNDKQAKDELTAILDVLIKSANTNHDKAAAVATKIQTFANQTQSDKTTLSGSGSTPGLLKYYDDKFGATSEDVTNLTINLAKQKKILKDANDEYDRVTVIAATSPSYAWIWPFGSIAAIVVAGEYGHEAVVALDHARAAQELIDGYSDDLAADAKLMVAINMAESGITNIVGPLNAALPIIQKIQGVWRAISDDLGNISELIKTDIQQAQPILMKMGVELAISKWTAVGNEANAYRINAYVTVKQ